MMQRPTGAFANLLASLCLLALVRPANADDWTAEFVFPATTGYVMHNLDVMEVSYKSNYPNASLWAFCYNGKEDTANLVIMGVYKNAKPRDGSQLFQFTNDFSSDFCWYNLRNLDNEEKGLNGIRFSYDWKTRDKPSTLKVGSKPEITQAPPSSNTADAPASTSASATPTSASTTKAAAPSSEQSTGASSPSKTTGPESSAATQTSGDSKSAGPQQGSGAITSNPVVQGTGTPLLNATAQLVEGTNSGSHPPPPLSGGIIAGIVVGAVLGVLGLFGFFAALWIVKRRKKSTLAKQSRRPESEYKGGFGYFVGRAEADGRDLPAELCGDKKPGLVELPG